MFRNGSYEHTIEHYLEDGNLFARHVVKCAYRKSEGFIVWWIAIDDNIIYESRVKVDNDNDALIRGDMWNAFIKVGGKFA